MPVAKGARGGHAGRAGCWRDGTAPLSLAAAQSAVIMARQVIPEDHAGEHPPAVPGSRTSSWSRNLARVTTRPPPGRTGTTPVRAAARLRWQPAGGPVCRTRQRTWIL